MLLMTLYVIAYESQPHEIAIEAVWLQTSVSIFGDLQRVVVGV